MLASIAPARGRHKAALLFVRLYRSLDAIVGGDDAAAGAWLTNRNTELRDEPLKLIQTVPGLMNVIQHLDSRRAVVRDAAALGHCWRLVEAQHRVSTLKLVDTVEEQAILEEQLQASFATGRSATHGAAATSHS